MGEEPIQVDSPAGSLDGVWLEPAGAVAQVVLAHGAGAGYQHKNMQGIAAAFADAELATLRFNFPYMQAGKRRVDNKATAVAAIAAARELAAARSNLPLFLAGHSFGGRMSSHAVAEADLDCRGLIFCSFPLHQPKKPDVSRASHLPDICQPMLFLSGTRDELAERGLLEEVVSGLAHARLHWLETANHSYVILKRTRTNPMPVFEEMARSARSFVDALI